MNRWLTPRLPNQYTSMEFKRRGSSTEMLTDRIYDEIYTDAVQSQLRSLSDDHDIDLVDRADGVHLFKTPISLDVSRGETIGG